MAEKGRKPAMIICGRVVLYQGSCGISLGYLLVRQGVRNSDLRTQPEDLQGSSHLPAKRTADVRAYPTHIQHPTLNLVLHIEKSSA
jgi:hypothetical protein